MPARCSQPRSFWMMILKFFERTVATPHRTGLSGERGGVVGGELLEGAGGAAEE